jgi:hypothetical protein
LVPGLNLAGQVSFLVDTGADTSIIHPRDALNLGIIFDRDFADSARGASSGVGGEATEYSEPCDVFLKHEDGAWDHIVMNVNFAEPTSQNGSFPSLMGRDLLRYYRLTSRRSAASSPWRPRRFSAIGALARYRSAQLPLLGPGVRTPTMAGRR